MDKIKLEKISFKNKRIEYNDYEIEVIPFLSLPQQAFLIEKYINDYFKLPETSLIENTKYHYLEAELNMKSYVFQLCTNIDTTNIDPDFYMNTILWKEITNTIENWYDFTNTLERVVSDIKQQEVLENSVGTVLFNLSKKAEDILNKISEFNPDDIKKAGDEGLKLIDRLEKSSVLNNQSDKILIAENSGLLPKEKTPRKRKGTK